MLPLGLTLIFVFGDMFELASFTKKNKGLSRGDHKKRNSRKNYSTQYSRVVPHHSTDCAITSLTSEIRRDPVLSSVYGRS